MKDFDSIEVWFIDDKGKIHTEEIHIKGKIIRVGVKSRILFPILDIAK